MRRKWIRKSISLLNRLDGSPPAAALAGRWLQDQGIRTVLDVGAHRGESSLAFRRILPNAWIIAFEPQRPAYDELLTRMAGDSRFRAFQAALGEIDGVLPFYTSGHTPSSSLLPMEALHKRVHPHTAETAETTVPVHTLDGLMQSLRADAVPIEAPALLKMDTQGYEGRVLQGAGQALELVQIVIAEVLYQDLYAGQSSFDEVYRLLNINGFTFRGHWADGRRSPLNGLPLYADALFLR